MTYFINNHHICYILYIAIVSYVSFDSNYCLLDLLQFLLLFFCLYFTYINFYKDNLYLVFRFMMDWEWMREYYGM